MTVRQFVNLVKDRPELLDAQLVHPVPGPSTVWQGLTQHVVHSAWYDPVANQVGVSGGGYPSNLIGEVLVDP